MSAQIGTGRVFYLKALPSGASTIVEVTGGELDPHGAAHVLPAPHSVSTAVYEYGGGAFEVLPSSSDSHAHDHHDHQRIVFSDARDGHALKLLDVDGGTVRALAGAAPPHLRYADFGPHPDPRAPAPARDLVLAVEEDHADPAPARVRNRVVVVDVGSGSVTRLEAGSGANFYSTPRFGPGGRWVSWRAWDHPAMPWTESRLCLAEVIAGADGVGPLVLGEVQVVAGGTPGECVGESAWGLDGALYFTHEEGEGDWRQLWRVRPGDGAKKERLRLEGLDDVEIGDCSMLMDW